MRGGDDDMERLHDFLLKELEPISEADPPLLANYVTALLKNNKPQKELKQLCHSQLLDFLGEATENFVTKLFTALEDGTVKISDAELLTDLGEGTQDDDPFIDDGEAAQAENDDILYARPASGPLNNNLTQDDQPSVRDKTTEEFLRNDNGGLMDEDNPEEGEQESSDEDDDRNHKHRRRGPSQLIDNNVEERLSGERVGAKNVDVKQDLQQVLSDERRGLGRGSNRQGGDMRDQRRGIGRPAYPAWDSLGRQDRRDSREPFPARVGLIPVGRFGVEGAQRGGHLGNRQAPFQIERPGGFDVSNGILLQRAMNHGIGVNEGWGRSALPDRRFVSPSFGEGQPHLLGPVTGVPGFFPGRGIQRGAVGPGLRPANPWGTFGPLPGGPNSMDRGPPIGPNGQPIGPNGQPIGPNGQPIGPNGQPIGLSGQPIGLNGQTVAGGIGSRARPHMRLGLIGRAPRMRCPDFEERGFCLRGDLCLMDHGADRIVLEDIKHLQQLNLPLAPGRSMGSNSVPSNPPPPLVTPVGRGRLEKDRILDTEKASPDPLGVSPPQNNQEELNGGEDGRGEHYDPDQLLWSRDRLRPKPVPGLRRLVSLKKPREDEEWDANADGSGVGLRPSTGLGLGGSTSYGSGSVWDRIGPPAEPSGAPAVPSQMGKIGQQGVKRGRNDFTDSMTWNGEPVKTVDPARAPSELPEGEGLPLKVEQTGGRGLGGNETYGEGRGSSEAHGGRSSSEAQGGRGSGRWGTGGAERERAQRTLFVRNLPLDAQNVESLLTQHFAKFGSVLSVKIPLTRDKAFVQFARKAEAEAALAAPEAVLGNRFISLLWAYHDNHPEHNSGSLAPANVVPNVAPNVVRNVVSNVVSTSLNPKSGNHLANTSVLAGNQGNGSTGNAFVTAGENASASSQYEMAQIAAAVQVKQREKLELLKEIQRRKGTLLKAKIEQQRKMLEKFGKSKPQSAIGQPQAALDRRGTKDGDSSSKEETPPKRSRVGDGNEGEAVKAPGQGGVVVSDSTLVSQNSTDVGANLDTSVSSSPGVPRPLSGGQQGPPRMTAGGPIRSSPYMAHMRNSPYHSPWGTPRNKIDNRTTVLRVLPPLPAAAMEPGAIWAHFSNFAEVSSVEMEPTEAATEASSEASGACRIVFANRTGAERAMVQGKWMHGAQLQLSWGPPATKAKPVTMGKSSAVGLAVENVSATGVSPSGGLPSLSKQETPANTANAYTAVVPMHENQKKVSDSPTVNSSLAPSDGKEALLENQVDGANIGTSESTEESSKPLVRP